MALAHQARASERSATGSKRGAIRGRCALYLIVAVLLASGIAGLAARYTSATRFPEPPLESWAMKIHGAAAMALLIVLGVIVDRHVLPFVRRRPSCIGGLVLLALFICQATGYGLWYFEGDRLRSATEWLHWGVGFALPCVLAWHIFRPRIHSSARTSNGARDS